MKEVILDPSYKLKSKKTGRSETVRVLLLFMTLRIVQLTCPLYPEGTADVHSIIYYGSVKIVLYCICSVLYCNYNNNISIG